jgi:glycosyltransferase involved in cell wall biosynthesis
MRVFHFLPWYSPASIGGTEIYILNLCKRLLQENVDVCIICPAVNGDELFEVDGVPVQALTSIQIEFGGEESLGIVAPSQLESFKRFLNSQQPDILHFHCFWNNTVYYLEAAKQAGVSTMITPHLAAFTCPNSNMMYMRKEPCDGKVDITRCTKCLLNEKATAGTFINRMANSVSSSLYRGNINTGYTSKLGRLFSLPFVVENQLTIFKRVVAATDMFVALSKWYKNVLIENGFPNKKVRLLMTTPAQLESNKITKRGNKLRLIFMGRQIEDKGLHTLLEAVKKINPVQLELHLAGKVYQNTLKEEVTLLQTNGINIIQHGEMPHAELMSVLSRMDVLCLPSNCMEMAPLVIQEGFARGVPAIGSNLGGIADAIQPGVNGLLFEVNNAEDLAKQILTLVTDPALLEKLKQSCRILQYRDIGNEYLMMYKALRNVEQIPINLNKTA